jgi:pyruvate/2-oxoglutarate dehydrogenase complex dihydrolipoamide dehydrogenase (E3) component
LEASVFRLDKRRIEVDEHFRNLPSIYAIGDWYRWTHVGA